jgi:3-hydroxypropanoate dehydrogenase
MDKLDDKALDLISREARTVSGWYDRAGSPATLKALWDLAWMGPTSANCSPMRDTFVVSDAAKARFEPFLISANVEQTMATPVVSMLAYDTKYYEHLPRLFMEEAVSWFTSSAELAQETTFRNATPQGAYFILGARALGLDCGPMPGFDGGGVDKEFFDRTSFKSNFLVNLGYGNHTDLDLRASQFASDKACEVV